MIKFKQIAKYPHVDLNDFNESFDMFNIKRNGLWKVIVIDEPIKFLQTSIQVTEFLYYINNDKYYVYKDNHREVYPVRVDLQDVKSNLLNQKGIMLKYLGVIKQYPRYSISPFNKELFNDSLKNLIDQTTTIRKEIKCSRIVHNLMYSSRDMYLNNVKANLEHIKTIQITIP